LSNADTGLLLKLSAAVRGKLRVPAERCAKNFAPPFVKNAAIRGGVYKIDAETWKRH